MTPKMVGIVLISHSASLAAGAAELVGQIAGGARVVPAGGTDDGRLGTSTDLILAAIAEADQGAGVLLLPDLGSSVISARMVLAGSDHAPAVAQVAIADAPFVEGAVAAGVAASVGADLAAVTQAAEEARDVRKL
ncbi:MAG TPA: dihydroxyacetone kinase phosphoryl donor subunit DhaM [Micromonosporaceae bacterium]|nr:dihydroxyacetone kinase phosphoryl donor subunit DhaM [Micromonosporaceae bacterium]